MENLLALYKEWSGAAPLKAETLPKAGSNRRYVRLHGRCGKTVIGVVGTSVSENHSFVYLASHFTSKGLPDPAHPGHQRRRDLLPAGRPRAHLALRCPRTGPAKRLPLRRSRNRPARTHPAPAPAHPGTRLGRTRLQPVPASRALRCPGSHVRPQLFQIQFSQNH